MESTEKNQNIELRDLTVWKSVQQARDASRPYTEDIIKTIFQDFREFHGDRRYADDPAIICGTALLNKQPLMIIGHQKGRDITQRRRRNFGMPKPEGYRKALRLMKLAEKFNRPLVTFIDTPGAYPGIDAEERGQAEAIARNLLEMSQLKIPIIVVVIGEGGSGGALAIAVGDYILMFENAIYSVITPEGCAAILWKSNEKAPEAAAALGLNAGQLLSNKIIDEIIREKTPWTLNNTKGKNGEGGMELEPPEVCENLQNRLESIISELQKVGVEELIKLRFEKFKKMGLYHL